MKKGFTLIELMGILVVLGIIILVAMPALVESNRQAKVNELKDKCSIIESACEAYRAVNSTATNVTIGDLKSGKYLKDNFDASGIGDDSTSIGITNEGCTIEGCNN